jgi:pyridoxine/pyridoxamine 5'-phosphate oxidase
MDVSEFINLAIKTIQRGTVDRKSPFRLPILSNSNQGRVYQRIVVARKFIENEMTVDIFTDSASKKYFQLKDNAECSLLFWDSKKKLQVTVHGIAFFDAKKLIYWQGLSENQKKDYMINPPPGTKLNTAKSFKYDSEARFAVISIKFKDMEVLELSPDGHKRAGCQFVAEGKKEYWLSP